MTIEEREYYEDNIREAHSLPDSYIDNFKKEKDIKLHKTIKILKDLFDCYDEESAMHYWNIMGNKNQIEFLINLVSNHYFYLFNRADESHSIYEIDALKSKIINIEAKKIINLLCQYKQKKSRNIQNDKLKNLDNFVVDLMEIITARFIFDDDINEKISNILEDTELIYYAMSIDKYKIIKEDLNSENLVISKASGINEIIEEISYYLYSTYYYNIQKIPFEKLHEYIPRDLLIYGSKDHNYNREKLNDLWGNLKIENQ